MMGAFVDPEVDARAYIRMAVSQGKVKNLHD
jgi:hypothetical protein